MLDLGHERTSLAVVCDQIGGPTSAAMLAKVSLGAIKQTLANPVLCGLYHVTAKGETSWYDYARFIFSEAKKMGAHSRWVRLKAVLSHAYSAAARRPLNSRLDTTRVLLCLRVRTTPLARGRRGDASSAPESK